MRCRLFRAFSWRGLKFFGKNNMDKNGALLVVFVFYLLISDYYAAETKVVKKDSEATLDPQNSTMSSVGNGSDVEISKWIPKMDSPPLELEKEGNNQLAEKDLENSELSNQTNSGEVPKVVKDQGSSSEDSRTEGKGEKDSLDGASKQVQNEGNQKRDSSISKSSRKEKSRTEECDASNRCVDEKNKLIACLRVPGDESPDLSLLIQNKGRGAFVVKISAPDYVELEESNVQLQQKEDKKVKVSVGKVTNNTAIILTIGENHCNLDFHNLISLSNSGQKNEHYSTSSNFLIAAPRASALYFLMVIVLLLGSALACVKFRRRKAESSEYEKVGMELPVSGGGKIESELADGWENSWGDSWDDEEAPRTPSKIVSSLSSKGLASRRSNIKEGWKD